MQQKLYCTGQGVPDTNRTFTNNNALTLAAAVSGRAPAERKPLLCAERRQPEEPPELQTPEGQLKHVRFNTGKASPPSSAVCLLTTTAPVVAGARSLPAVSVSVSNVVSPAKSESHSLCANVKHQRFNI